MHVRARTTTCVLTRKKHFLPVERLPGSESRLNGEEKLARLARLAAPVEERGKCGYAESVHGIAERRTREPPGLEFEFEGEENWL